MNNRYRKLYLFPVISFSFIFLLQFPVWSEIVLTEISGKVEVQLPGETWSRAEKGMALPLETMISTGFNSTASLDLGSSTIHLQEFTRMFVRDLAEKGGVITTDLQLNVGKIRAQVESSEGLTHDFNVLSTVSVASVRGTEFEYDGESLYCIRGKVLFFNLLRQKRTLMRGEEVRLAADEPPLSPEETFLIDAQVQVQPSHAPGIPGADEPDPILPDPDDYLPNSAVTVTVDWPD